MLNITHFLNPAPCYLIQTTYIALQLKETKLALAGFRKLSDGLVAGQLRVIYTPNKFFYQMYLILMQFLTKEKG